MKTFITPAMAIAVCVMLCGCEVPSYVECERKDGNVVKVVKSSGLSAYKCVKLEFIPVQV